MSIRVYLHIVLINDAVLGHVYYDYLVLTIAGALPQPAEPNVLSDNYDFEIF